MTFKDINERFTAVCKYYFDDSFTINTGTMGGSEGEIAKVDFTNGKHIFRVALIPFSNGFMNGVQLITGRCTDGCEPNSEKDFQTLWNNHLHIILQENYYKIPGQEDCYGTQEEAAKAFEDYYKEG